MKIFVSSLQNGGKISTILSVPYRKYVPSVKFPVKEVRNWHNRVKTKRKTFQLEEALVRLNRLFNYNGSTVEL